jgi:hypothetical protein
MIDGVDTSPIGHDQSLKAPIFAEDGAKEKWVLGNVSAVHFVVTCTEMTLTWTSREIGRQKKRLTMS